MGNVDYSNFHDRAIGSSGGMIKHLQNLLNKKGGYGLAEDGIFGSETEKAVRDFQKKNGLTVDGIIGKNTLAKLQTVSDYVKPTTSNENTGFTYNPFEYKDFEESKDLTDAGDKKNKTNTLLEGMNNTGFTYDKQLQEDDIWNKIFGREKFNFNFNEDALYQQYKDKYIKQGKMAMQDTIGQASAMTGGYGNSYAQSVGNQAYQAALEQLNDVIPELYQMAYDRYNQEGQDLYNKYSMLSNDKATEYGMWNDKYNRLAGMRDYYQTDENNLYNKERGEYESDRTFNQNVHDTEESYRYQNYADQIAQDRWEKEYDLSERELAMAEEEWGYKKKAYQDAELESNGFVNGVKVSNGNKQQQKQEQEPTQTMQPKESGNTTSFINSHQTKDEFMARGDKTYKEYVAYIEGEIEKAEGNLSDEEILYLIRYYGLS